MRTLRTPLLLAAAALVWLAGCSSGPTQIRQGPVYKSDLTRAPTANIQVFRRSTTIELTNTTAQAFGPSTIWLNGRFGRAIDGLAVGQSLELRLAEFRDQFDEAFRGGGFFATEKPDRLVLAELETDGKLVGLVVVGGEDE